ncbi:hypothetical protein [Sphingobium aromaticiconvertens]|uniref:hypothetical protein n=1 Tax=Sphingobium aromaticiconvertens TaxID=365341 RepID=UPI0030176BE9
MALVDLYVQYLETLVRFFGASHTIMHVHAGLAIYLGSQLLLRDRRASVIALKIVLAVAIGHECIERLYYGSWRWNDTLADIGLTLLWPAAITASGLYRRRRWRLAERGTRVFHAVAAQSQSSGAAASARKGA